MTTKTQKDQSRKCPFTAKVNHEWRPKQADDSRSPCPALNTLANHGYLPRDGKNISVWDLIAALKAGYNLSTPLAWVLAFGGFYLIKQWGRISLGDLARHGCVEHDASLAHENTPPGKEYAPIEVVPHMVETLCKNVPVPDGCQGEEGMEIIVMSADDVASARVRRERECPKALDPVHAEIARGEMAIALGMVNTRGAGGKYGIPIDWLREWISCEKIPDGWEPDHTQGLIATIRMSAKIRNEMKRLRKEAGEDVDGKKKSEPDAADVTVSIVEAEDELTDAQRRAHVRSASTDTTLTDSTSDESSSSQNSLLDLSDGKASSTPGTSREPSQERTKPESAGEDS